MRLAPVCCLTLMSVSTACQSLPSLATRRVAIASQPIAVEAQTSLAPGGSPTVEPSAPPALGSVALHGQVQIDASYVLSLDRGQILSNNGSSVLKLDGSTMLDDTDIGVLSHNGGSLLSHNGGSLVSHNGGTIISQNGAGLISDKGTGYRVLATPTIGDVLPAAGMGVMAISLTTGKALGPAVATDANGNFSLGIPADQQGNVLVVAEVPGRDRNDPILDNPRLLYSVAMPAGTAADQLDEDTALVTRYMRLSYARVLLQFLQSKPGTPATFDVPLSPTTQAIAQGLASQLRDEAAAVPASSLPALAERLTDLAIAQIDFAHTRIDATGTAWKGPDEPAVSAMVDVLREVRRAAIAKMSRNPHYFDTAPYVLKANAALPPEEAFHIVRPSDLGDFLFEMPADAATPFVDILDDLGVDPLESDHLNAAEIGLSEQFAVTLLKPQVNALVRATIQDFVPANAGSFASTTAG